MGVTRPSRNARRLVVAIPAQNEADHIRTCLDAFERQNHPVDAVLLLVNNSHDATHEIAEVLQADLTFDLRVVPHAFPPEQSDAGHARRLAMELGADLAGPDGILFTTDADGVVPPDWIARNLQALDQGRDAVCGRAVLDPRDAHLIPAHLHEDDRLECRLIELLDQMAWLLDPEAHDPWPRHTEASGASLAVTMEAFRRVGGIPPIASGEDRAFVRALWVADRRIRHDPDIVVTVSGRLNGRARGGMADTIRRRIVQQDELTDEQVEPAQDAWRRYRLRRQVRAAWQRGNADRTLAARLGVPDAVLTNALSAGFFGAAWARLESASPVLARRRVPFTALSDEIDIAEAQLGSRDQMAAD